MEAVIAGAAEAPYDRHPPADRTTPWFLADAAMRVLRLAGLPAARIDGMAVSSFSLAPDHAIDLAWRLGLSLRWIMQDTNGGASAINMLGHARRAIECGDADAILILAGDAQAPADVARRQATFNRATAEHLAPIGYGGPNSLFAMLTQRQMAATGLDRGDYAHIPVAQRRWAAGNPGAAYRDPLTREEYLGAPVVADPLCLYDCPPGVAGADALIVTRRDLASGAGGPPVAIRALRSSFNHDHQAGDGLRTGAVTYADRLWEEAGIGPADVDVACVYDDYPAMVLAQLDDLGFVPDGDLPRFARTVIGPGRLALNTSGGLLSAGQAGAAGGLHGIVEAVRQLRGEAEGRQVAGARHALVTGYGMILYRYGAAAGAAVLEAVT
jgi:acetyl-CoA acetyltransferase